MKTSKSVLLKTTLAIAITLPALFFFNNCGGGGGGGGGSSSAGSIVQVPMVISSGGLTVGMNSFKFDRKGGAKPDAKFSDFLQELLWSTAYAIPSSYRVSPDKAKLRITNISIQSVEQNVDTSTESTFNTAQICEVDYDKANPNQTVTCTVELQVGLHYKTIDFKVAPNVDIYLDDSTHGLFTTAAGVQGSDPGAALDYFTANFNNNNTSFHADFPFQVDTTALNTTLSKINTIDGCGNTIETKMVLSNATVLSDTTFTPSPACGTPGTSQTTTNIGTQNLNVVVDMIHGIEVDRNGGTLTVSTTVPWWTIVGTIGASVGVKHFASTASGVTALTYGFPPPGGPGIGEVKIAYANGVAVAAQMIPNGFSASFCHEDYDTPDNSPGNGYVGSDSNGAAWAVGPWSNGSITNYTSEYYLNTTTGLFSCILISADPNPAPGQALDTFSAKMPDPTGFTFTQGMTRID